MDRYTAEVLAGDERKAEEILQLIPSNSGDFKELLALVKELSVIYQPIKPSARFRENLLNLIKARFKPSPLRTLIQWTREHKQEITIGTAIAGSACSLIGIIAYFVKVKKAAA